MLRYILFNMQLLFMLKKLLNIFLLTISLLSVMILIISPAYLFNNETSRQIRMSFAKQKVAPQRLFVNSWRTIKAVYIDPTMNNQDWNRWKRRYLKQIKTNDDVIVAVNSMLASLDDENSEFLNSKKFKLQSDYIKENSASKPKFKPDFITRKKDKKPAKILLTTIAGVVSKAEVVASSSSYSDPKVHDEIVGIDGYPLLGTEMNTAIKLIQGKNSIQRLNIIRNGKIITTISLQGSMDIDKMSSELLPEKILLINIFTLMEANSIKYFVGFLNNYPNIKGIIIDLRGNAGGLFPNAIDFADVFIDNGTITTIEYRNGYRIDVNAQIPYNILKKPTVILIDKRTASASEVFAGALKYNKAAILVGTNTYGKTSIQKIIPMQNNMGINITIAKYLVNKNCDITKRGIEPDYKVGLSIRDILNNDDKQLKEAIKIINQAAAKNNSKR